MGLKGTWTAIITPFDSKGGIDYPSYRKLLQDQKDAGITGVVPCGTTGESATLSTDEKKKLIQFTQDELRGTDVRVMAGTGSNNTANSVEFSRWASENGVDAVLIVTPYYNKPSQAGLEAHFNAVADAVNCEVVLYNVPGRTAVSLEPATIARLAKHPRITTIKEATGSLPFTSQLQEELRKAGSEISILSGDDATYLGLLSLGASGVISASSNLLPRSMIKMLQAFESGDLPTARKLNEKCYPLFRDLFIESNPVPVKTAMAYVGLCEEHLRAPLAPMSAENREKLMATLKESGIKPGQTL